MTVRQLLQAQALTLVIALVGCDDKEPQMPESHPEEAPPAPETPDRLPPGELLEGTERIYDFPVPRRMKIDAKFADRAHLLGEVGQRQLSDYVRKRVLTRHVQVEGRRYIFPKVRIRGGGPDLFRMEIVKEGAQTRLIITEIEKKKPLQGLTEAERWERAGMRPDGSLIDPQNLQ